MGLAQPNTSTGLVIRKGETMKSEVYFLPLIFTFLVILTTFNVVYFTSGAWRKNRIFKVFLRKKLKPPISEKLLNSPGESLRKRIDDLQIDLNADISVFSIFNYTLAILSYFLLRDKSSILTAMLLITLFVAGNVYFFFKLKGTKDLIRSFRLGLAGELATAQELNQLMYHGYFVYHDMPGEGFNIDHVVIGPTGVYAVETKTPSKVVSNNKIQSTACYEKNAIFLYGTKNTEYIKQAKEQAKWLSNYLKKSVGKDIKVTPVLSLPGWYIEYKSHDDNFIVLNPKLSVSLITKRPVVLDEQTIKQIQFQIEQRCRTVEVYNPY